MTNLGQSEIKLGNRYVGISARAISISVFGPK
jgi:hypothetical protein